MVVDGASGLETGGDPLSFRGRFLCLVGGSFGAKKARFEAEVEVAASVTAVRAAAAADAAAPGAGLGAAR